MSQLRPAIPLFLVLFVACFFLVRGLAPDPAPTPRVSGAERALRLGRPARLPAPRPAGAGYAEAFAAAAAHPGRGPGQGHGRRPLASPRPAQHRRPHPGRGAQPAEPDHRLGGLGQRRALAQLHRRRRRGRLAVRGHRLSGARRQLHRHRSRRFQRHVHRHRRGLQLRRHPGRHQRALHARQLRHRHPQDHRRRRDAGPRASTGRTTSSAASGRCRINPPNPSIVWAGTTEGTYKSTDAGADLEPGARRDHGHRPGDRSRRHQPGVRGLRQLRQPRPGHLPHHRRRADLDERWSARRIPATWAGKAQLAVSPGGARASSTPASATATSAPTGPGSCARPTAASPGRAVVHADYARWQGWFSHDVAVNPSNPDLVIAVGIDIWKSTNGGTGLCRRSRTGRVVLRADRCPANPRARPTTPTPITTTWSSTPPIPTSSTSPTTAASSAASTAARPSRAATAATRPSSSTPASPRPR